MGAAYAYADSNTMGAPAGGEGSGAVSGFVASDVHYDLVSGNPSVVEGVSFSLDVQPPAGSTLEVSLDGGGTWSPCTASAADVDCSTPATPLSGVGELKVVAAQ